MHKPQQSPTRGPDWRRRIIALAALSLLAGCANGDFGEVQPSLVRDDIHDWLGSNVIDAQSFWPRNIPLTDDERQLRDLAYPLIEAPYNRQQWYSVAGEYGLTEADSPDFDRSAYANRLISKYFRSATTRYARLTEDIRNDTTRLPQFFETAARVLDIDQKRRKSLDYVSKLSKSERDNALRRIRENTSIVFKVRTKLDQRVAAYRFALERLVIMTPMQQAVDVERSLNQLQAQIEHYRSRSAPTWVREHSLAAAR